ncbi:MAG: flagellar basal body P-ring protein FlgI [Planctomycetota bacterium]
MRSEDASAVRSELQKPHTAREREAILRPKSLRSIGDVATIDGLSPEAVIGFGLVTGLGESGSDKGSVPAEIIREVRKNLIREENRTVDESAFMVTGRDSSIVEVRGFIPPGAVAGDTFGVVLRPIDSATSLENGYLHTTALTAFLRQEGGVQRGDAVARARGQVTAGVTGDEAVLATVGDPRVGVVFEGARFDRERILLIRLKDSYVSGRRTVLIEYLINRRFSQTGLAPGDSPLKYAFAMSNRMISLRVPPVYRKFVQRYADVVRSIRGSYFYGPPKSSVLEGHGRALATGPREQKYAASVALEGVGDAAIPHLEGASGDDWTLLYSGQALAYLNNDLGRTRVIEATDSETEEVRYEAVRFVSQLAGRSAIQALRAKVFDPSGRISIEALEGLVAQGEESARKLRLSGYDIIAVKGADPGLIVRSRGRPLIAVTGVDTRLEGTIGVRIGEVGIGSTDETHVGIMSGLAVTPESVVVEATMANILATLAKYNVPFETVKNVIAAMEDAGNVPYEVTWVD